MKSPALIATCFTASALLLIATACNLAAPPPPANLVATEIAATLQALASSTQAPSPTKTFTSTFAPFPTLTSAPTNTPLPAATRINFAQGATEAVVTGTIQAGQVLTYVAGAAKDQPMIVSLDTTATDAKLTVFGANGKVLLSPKQEGNWQGLLPNTQDYYFVITSNITANFSLNLIIVARIQFESGQTSIKLSGSTVGGFGVSYVVYAFKGQRLDVTVNTNPDDAALTIWGFSDGSPYARAQNGVTDFSMVLPTTQDYIISVIPQGGRVIDYTITIKIK